MDGGKHSHGSDEDSLARMRDELARLVEHSQSLSGDSLTLAIRINQLEMEIAIQEQRELGPA